MTFTRILNFLSLCLTVSSSISISSAQIFRLPAMTPPGRSLAGTDDSDALALNPSQIAFSPSWHFKYTHIQIPNDATTAWPGTGDSIGVSSPLVFGVATGFRLEFIRPPEASSMPNFSSLQWSLAYALARSFAISFDLRHWFSSVFPRIDNATAIGASLAWRPSSFTGVSLVARNLNAPRDMARSVDVGLALRPFGTRSFELGFETALYEKKLDTDSQWAPRFTLGTDIPYVGRANASFQWMPTSGPLPQRWFTSIGLEIGFDSARVGGGILTSKTFGSSNVGWYASASIAGFTEPGIPTQEYVARIRIEETPGTRGHVRLLRRLARLERDPLVRGVVFIAKSDLANSTAYAEELADAMASLQAKGKPVFCHFEDVGARSLLACSGAHRIWIHPAGGIRFSGLKSQHMYFGSMLEKIGIEPDFIRIREHKTAPEAYVRKGPTPMALRDQREILDGLESVYLDRLARGRRMQTKIVKTNIGKGPFVADEAVAAGFSDAKVFDDEIDNSVKATIQSSLPIREEPLKTKSPIAFGSQPKIAVVYLDGNMIDGRSQKIPILNEKLVGSYSVAEALKQAREDSSIKGVLLRIESPGGSSVAGDVIWREAELLIHAKPVVVSMGSIAASGGYYAAAFGAPIYANRSTITGSIGIFYGKADVSKFFQKIGINISTQKTHSKADAESLFRAFTPEERIELGHKIEQLYAIFLDRIARGRSLSIEQIDRVGRGKTWLGSAAKQHRLIDVVGGFNGAFDALRQELHLPQDVAIVELPNEKAGLIDFVLDALTTESTPNVKLTLPQSMMPMVQSMLPFLVYKPDQALTLWEGLMLP